MTGCGRRLALRAGVAWCAAAIAFSATTVVSQAAGNQLKIALQVGYHNTVKLGQWMPVTVDLTNPGPDLDGTLEIQTSNSAGGGPPIGTAVYQAPVSLASGATKHFRTYVTQDFPGTVQARVTQNGREVASQEVSSGNTITGLMVGVLSDQPSTLDGFAIARPGGNLPLIVHMTVADLSDSAPVLRAFDVLAIDDFSTDTLTAGQKTALADYVMQGGALVLGTGGSWHKTLAGLPTRIVPMNVTGSTVLASSSALGGAAGVEVATGTLAAGSRTWVAEGALPLLLEEPAGKGSVEMSTFDWAQDSIANSSTAVGLLRQVLVRVTYGNTSAPTPTGPMVGKFGMGTSIAAKGGGLGQALGNLPALTLPAWWLIGALVLVYVLLVGPVNYFVLRAVGRRALAWITVPAIALVASGGAYGTSVITKGTSVVANEVSIIHVQQGWDRAYQEEYTGILAPTRGDYEVAIGGGHALISPVYYYTANITDVRFAAMRVNTTTDAITLPGMSAFTLRGFANESVLAAAPQLTGQIQLTQGQLTGTVTNVSSMQFTDGVALSGNSFQKLGRLAPGGSSSFTLQPTTTNGFGPPAYPSIYSNNYGINGYGPPPSSTSDADRENQMRTAILSAVMGNMYGGMQVSTQPTVVLWTRQPFQSVTVNGGHPRLYSESAVVITLPVGQIGTGHLPAGVVPGRMVDIDADTSQGGPPGMVMARAGSVTFSFAPPLVPGMHLGSVAISNQNPYGMKGVVGPNGGTSTVKAQVWDWSTSAWVDVSFENSGLTLVPDAAVNPTTGEVRLRLSSDGQFAAGSLSLSGSVS